MKIVSLAHTQLSAFIGRWVIVGDVTGEDAYTWMEGGHFIRGQFAHRAPGTDHVGESILGYDDARRVYSMRNFDNLGFAREYEMQVDGETWTIRGATERAKITFGAGGTSMHQKWEALRDGTWEPFCEVIGTRIRCDREQLVRLYLDAYVHHDRESLEGCFADDFRFTSPRLEQLDLEWYLKEVWPNHENTRSIDVERVVVDGDHALVEYLIATNDGRHLHNVEQIDFAGERIASIEVFRGVERDAFGVVRQAA